MNKKKIIALIPCRYESSRFWGKPLALINNKPMMYYVYNTAKLSNLFYSVYIVTNHMKIVNKCRELDMNYLYSKKKHLTGTDRIAEFIDKLDFDYCVNIQGDEPMIKKKSLNILIREMLKKDNNKYLAFNGYHKIERNEDAFNENIVKTIFNKQEEIIYFSRKAIPTNSKVGYFRQIGLYGFKKKALRIFKTKKQGPIEISEGIEMLRLIENNISIRMIKINELSKSVDTQDDLAIVRKLMKNEL